MQHMQNAILEYTANLLKIMRTLGIELGNESLLRVLLQEEKVAIYDNNNWEYLRRIPPKSPHMDPRYPRSQRERWLCTQG